MAGVTTTVAEASRRRVRRFGTGLRWFDRAMGGGLVEGTVVVLHGAPGAMKSTLLAQIADGVEGAMYVSAEESAEQVAARCRRLGVRSDLVLVEEEEVGAALEACEGAPLVVLDSVQRMYVAGVKGRAGGMTQVVAVGRAAVDWARETGACVVIVCQETKSNVAAGPRALEHDVDVMVGLTRSPRALVVEKNRYGEVRPPVALKATGRGLRSTRPTPEDKPAAKGKKATARPSRWGGMRRRLRLARLAAAACAAAFLAAAWMS